MASHGIDKLATTEQGRSGRAGSRNSDAMRNAGSSSGARSTQPERKLIGFLAFDGVDALHLAAGTDVFAAAQLPDDEYRPQPAYDTVWVALQKRRFVSHSGVVFIAHCLADSAPPIDTIIVPGGMGLFNPQTRSAVAQWLSERAPSLRRIAAVGTGIFPLAFTGLLDNRHVTTHWRYAADVSRTFPTLRVALASSYVSDGRFYTCGGAPALLELGVGLIKEDYGEEVATQVAREFLVNLRPSSGFDHEIPSITVPARTEQRLAALPQWIATRLHQTLSVEVLAEQSRLCPRHFSRLFKQTYSLTPADFVERLRLKEAARRLAAQDCTVESVSKAVGFRSATAFRLAFERVFDLTPSQFRNRNLRMAGRAKSAKRQAAN